MSHSSASRRWLWSALLLLGAAGTAAAQTPATSLQALAAKDLATLEQKYVSLAEALPAEAYAWRPAEGVRSAQETFAHVAGANYMIPQFLDVAMPEAVRSRFPDPGAFDRVTDKAELVQLLRDSFAHARTSVAALPDAKLAEPVEMFGNQTTRQGALLLLLGHAHEHLGQLVAYARSNDVTPPWSN